MKLPDLPKRKPTVTSPARSSRAQAPAFLQDLYKDMRDRRLIIPAVALLIAIVAVPVMLSHPADSTVITPPPVNDPAAVAVEPAVLTAQEEGVREFRERLDALKRKNPFGGRFDPKVANGSSLPGELVEPVDSGGSGSGNGNPGTDPVDLDTPVDPVESVDPVEPAPSGPPEPVFTPEAYVLVPRIDVTVGVVDRDRRQTLENVKVGDLLPSREAPTAMFLGNTDDSEFAEFVISRDVEAMNGEGKCEPRKNKCEFLRL
ncbi:MAG: hypothetical protein M3331_08490, partial [Actinomycetota bacterium]|nr:hypothetical protein [Actinomycetota bacterium]